MQFCRVIEGSSIRPLLCAQRDNGTSVITGWDEMRFGDAFQRSLFWFDSKGVRRGRYEFNFPVLPIS